MELPSIIIYYEKGLFFSGEFVEEKNERTRIKTENEKIFWITNDKIIRKTNINIKLSKFIESSKSLLMKSKDLWETVRDLSDDFSLNDLTELIHGENYDDVSFYSVLLSLMEEPVYFVVDSKGKISPQKENIIKEYLNTKKIDEDKKQKKEQEKLFARSYIVEALKTNIFADQTPDEVTRFLTPCIEYAIQLDDFSGKQEAISLYKSLLEEAGIKDEQNDLKGIFNLLVSLKIIDNYDSLILRRNNIKTSYAQFPEPEPDEYLREDFRNHRVFSIDGIETKDIDDALSFIEENEQYCFYIHIADPDSYIHKGDDSDQEAFVRGTSIYLVTLRYPMFHPDKSYSLFSLIEGQDRFAVTLKIVTDKSYNIIQTEFLLSNINNHHRLTYDQADMSIENNNDPLHETINHFLNFSQANRDKRLEDGALMLDYNDLTFSFDENGVIYYTTDKANSNSHIIVQEMMILFNKSTAHYCITHNLDSIFISQESPNEPIVGKQKDFNRQELNSIFPRLKKSVTGRTPGQHYCLGLPFYTQATSPIRRYLDLVIHRIIKSSILNLNHPYTEDELQIIIATISSKSLNATIAERESIKYHSLLYIQSHMDIEYRALALKRIPGGILCEIEDILLKVQASGSEKVEIGDSVFITFNKVFPYTADVSASFSINSRL